MCQRVGGNLFTYATSAAKVQSHNLIVRLKVKAADKRAQSASLLDAMPSESGLRGAKDKKRKSNTALCKYYNNAELAQARRATHSSND